MPLFTGTQEQYYANQQTFSNANGSITGSGGEFTLNFNPLPATEADFQIFIDDVEQNTNTYVYSVPGGSNPGRIVFDTAPADGSIIIVRQTTFGEDYGNYQYITLQDAVNNFLFGYVGEDKIIPKVRRADVLFHAQRSLQELSYDTLKSEKSQEIEVPPSLKMALPHDYVNYVKVCYIDNEGVERVLMPARKTSNPKSLLQNDDFGYIFNEDGTLLEANDSTEWTRYQANSGSSNQDLDMRYDINDFDTAEGRRYGLEPENAQLNGIFYIDQYRGYIHFSSTMAQKTIVLKYISDGVATEEEKIIHKFAEEAIYKSIALAILSVRQNIPEYVIQRFKKEKRAAIRTAKLRLSNLKIEELSQVMRGKSKFIKH
jgi:hypothetical protein